MILEKLYSSDYLDGLTQNILSMFPNLSWVEMLSLQKELVPNSEALAYKQKSCSLLILMRIRVED